jgi:hypothetical protein
MTKKKDPTIVNLMVIVKASNGKLYQVVTQPSTDKGIMALIACNEKMIKILDKPIEGIDIKFPKEKKLCLQ